MSVVIFCLQLILRSDADIQEVPCCVMVDATLRIGNDRSAPWYQWRVLASVRGTKTHDVLYDVLGVTKQRMLRQG